MTSSGKWDVFLDGVGYMLFEEPDTAFGSRPALEHQSVRAQREQSVAQGNIGEATVNPLGFWRRSIDGWHDGAGQTYQDRAESDSLRFHSSQGVDVFGTRHQLTLLHRLDQATTFAGGDPMLLSTAGFTYICDGATLQCTATPLTTPWSLTTVTGTPTAIDGLTTIGGSLFVAGGTDGVYSGTIGGASVSSYATGSATGVAVAKGRLMAWGTSDLYNIVAPGAFPSALVTFSTGNIVGVVGAGNAIYIAVFGEPSFIYKTSVKPDGTALDVPTVAGELPDGETLVSFPLGSAIFSYLNNLFVLTNKGIRMGVLDANGNITFGSIIPTDGQTNIGAWTAFDRFVWCGAALVGGGSVTKLDLSTETLPNTPAFASDADTGHLVQAMTVHNGRLIVADNTKTVYVESADHYVTSGRVDSGLVALDLADPKTPVDFDIEAAYPSDSSITASLSTDRGGSFTSLGVWDTAASAEKPITGIAGSRQFEIRATLTASSDKASTPTLYRHTLKTEPAISQDVLIQVKLRLYESIVDNGGMTVRQDPEALRVGLEALQKSRAVVTFTRGGTSYQVTVRDLDTEAHSRCAAPRDGTWNTLATATLKVIS